MRGWLLKNAEYKKLGDRIRYRANARKIVLAKHGVTPEWYDTILAAQDGGCAICGGPPGGRWSRFAVDHDHETGAPRGLLCNDHNLGLGMFKDHIEDLRFAIAYLEKHASQPSR